MDVVPGPHGIAIDANRLAVCWGDNSLGETLVPFGVTQVIQVGSDYGASYALSSDGVLRSWGQDSRLPPETPGVAEFAQAPLWGELRQIILRYQDGTVSSAGGFVPSPPGLDSVTAVAAGVYHALAVRSNGEVVSWGFPGDPLIATPKDLTAPVAIVAGVDRSMALGANGQVSCWGTGEVGVPAAAEYSVAIAAGCWHSVALTTSGEVVCWGQNASGQCDVPAGITRAVAIAAGNTSTVVLGANGEVHSWGDIGAPPPIDQTVTAVRARGGQSVAITADGTPVCWGVGCVERPEPIGRIAAIAAGSDSTVLLDEFGTVRCFGDNSLGQCDAPVDLGAVRTVAAASTVTLALQTDGTQRAWGAWIVSTAVIYCVDGLRNIAAMDGGGAHAVFMTSEGGVICSGWNLDGRCSVPEGLGPVRRVSAGGAHTVAVALDGTVAAWGGLPGTADVPAGLEDVVSASAGAEYTLAVRSDGTVRCWGWPFVDCSVPADLAAVVDVEAGGINVALLRGGGIVCWPSPSSSLCEIADRVGPVASVAVGGVGSGTLLTGVDCNLNRIPDDLELRSGGDLDCNSNGRIDACELAEEGADCDLNGLIDSCEIASQDAQDCDGNLVVDVCDIASGFDSDGNENGIPDACEYPWGDLTRDGVISSSDISRLLTEWGSTEPSLADLDRDGSVGASDLSLLLLNWGSSPG